MWAEGYRRDARGPVGLRSGRGDRAAHRGHPARGLRAALHAVPSDQLAGEAAFRGRRLGRRAAGGQGARPLLRRARPRMRRAAARGARRRRPRRRRVAAGEAPLHRAARRLQAPGARRDVLQLGDHADPRPDVRPQRVHLRPRGDLDRVHRVDTAHLPELLPGGGRPRHDARRGVQGGRLGAPVLRPGGRRRARARRVAPASRRDVARARAELPAPGAELALLPQQGGIPDRTHPQRAPRAAAGRPGAPRAGGPSRARHGHSRPRGRQHPLLALSRVLHDRYGRAVGDDRVPAGAHADEAALGAVHGGRARQAGQDALLPRPPAAPPPLARPVRRGAGDTRPGDARVLPALVSRTCSR